MTASSASRPRGAGHQGLEGFPGRDLNGEIGQFLRGHVRGVGHRQGHRSLELFRQRAPPAALGELHSSDRLGTEPGQVGGRHRQRI